MVEGPQSELELSLELERAFDGDNVVFVTLGDRDEAAAVSAAPVVIGALELQFSLILFKQTHFYFGRRHEVNG